jgi:hypothetical protein
MRLADPIAILKNGMKKLWLIKEMLCYRFVSSIPKMTPFHTALGQHGLMDLSQGCGPVLHSKPLVNALNPIKENVTDV